MRTLIAASMALAMAIPAVAQKPAGWYIYDPGEGSICVATNYSADELIDIWKGLGGSVEANTVSRSQTDAAKRDRDAAD